MKRLVKTLEINTVLGVVRCQSKHSIHEALRRANKDDSIWSSENVRIVLCNRWDKKHFRRGIAFRGFK